MVAPTAVYDEVVVAFTMERDAGVFVKVQTTCAPELPAGLGKLKVVVVPVPLDTLVDPLRHE